VKDQTEHDSNLPLLKIEGLRVSFRSGRGTVVAVDGIDLQVMPGEALGIVGESGSGKSVSNLAVLDLLPRPQAQVEAQTLEFEGRSLLDLSPEEMRQVRGAQIAMVFQDPMTALNPFMRISGQMAEVLESHTDLSRKDIRQACIHMLDRVGIPDPEQRIDAYPHEFSGGMRQRVLIAMALLGSPKLLIADEPTTALDVTIQAQILELIGKMKEEGEMAMILVTHDLGVVAEVVDRVLVMYGGRVMEEAPTDQIFLAPSHPYTKALLSCLPRLDGEEERLEPIEGNPPEGMNRPPGCPFEPRCPNALDVCSKEVPRPYGVGKNHVSYCWLHDEEKSV
jgi:oligopeptide/dipeptide ABC transporter ATP-binding protein